MPNDPTNQPDWTRFGLVDEPMPEPAPLGGDVVYVPVTLDRYGRAVLTVGELRAALDGVDDDLHVVLDDGDGWYDNVEHVIVPGTDSGLAEHTCVTLMRGDNYDARQG